MANTKDLGRLFVQFVALADGAPFYHTAISQAIEPPYPRAKAHIFRVPRTHLGVVLGLWRPTGFTEEEALLAAMEGKGLDLYDIDLDNSDVRATVRKNIADASDSWDEEWEIINMLGVVE